MASCFFLKASNKKKSKTDTTANPYYKQMHSHLFTNEIFVIVVIYLSKFKEANQLHQTYTLSHQNKPFLLAQMLYSTLLFL